MKKITACLLILAIWMLFPVTVGAQKTTLTAKIPFSHTLHVDIVGNGEVIVDGVSCKQAADLQILRGTTPQIIVKSADGTVLKSAFCEEKEITEELREGTYIMPEMRFDANLTVIFEAAPGTPQTGDPVPATALCFSMVLSLTGVLYCLLFTRKRKI